MPHVFTPFSELKIPEKRRRDLPHWEIEGATYFLTFRLADSIPTGVIGQINHSVAAWLKLHNLSDRREVQWLSEREQMEFRKLISVQEEAWLDRGSGSCVLREKACREHLVAAFEFFDGERYALDAYVIMPNHVHLLVQPIDGWSLSSIAGSWKQYSARRINVHLGQSGSFWQKETFDHIVRTAAKLEECRRYIAANPQKARLKAGEYYVGRGSGIDS